MSEADPLRAGLDTFDGFCKLRPGAAGASPVGWIQIQGRGASYVS